MAEVTYTADEILAAVREKGASLAAADFGLKPRQMRAFVRKAGRQEDYAKAILEWQAKVARERFTKHKPPATPEPSPAQKPAAPEPERAESPPEPQPEKVAKPHKIQIIREGTTGSLTAEVRKSRPAPVKAEPAKKEKEEEEPRRAKSKWGLPKWAIWVIVAAAGLILVMIFFRRRFQPATPPPPPTPPPPSTPQPPPTPPQPSDEDIIKYWRQQFGLGG